MFHFSSSIGLSKNIFIFSIKDFIFYDFLLCFFKTLIFYVPLNFVKMPRSIFPINLFLVKIFFCSCLVSKLIYKYTQCNLCELVRFSWSSIWFIVYLYLNFENWYSQIYSNLICANSWCFLNVTKIFKFSQKFTCFMKTR